MSDRIQDVGVSDCFDDELRADPDHRAIVARRDLLVALAVAGLASVAACSQPLRLAPTETDGGSVSDGANGLALRDAVSGDTRADNGGDASPELGEGRLDASKDLPVDEEPHCGCFSCGSACGCT